MAQRHARKGTPGTKLAAIPHRLRRDAGIWRPAPGRHHPKKRRCGGAVFVPAGDLGCALIRWGDLPTGNGKLRVMIPELLEANGVVPPDGDEFPYRLSIEDRAAAMRPDGRLCAGRQRRLREAGCWCDRQGKGDHEIWYSPHTGRRFPVDNKIKSRQTANDILKQAGLPKAF
jgi:hypothetical protein